MHCMFVGSAWVEPISRSSWWAVQLYGVSQCGTSRHFPCEAVLRRASRTTLIGHHLLSVLCIRFKAMWHFRWDSEYGVVSRFGVPEMEALDCTPPPERSSRAFGVWDGLCDFFDADPSSTSCLVSSHWGLGHAVALAHHAGQRCALTACLSD